MINFVFPETLPLEATGEVVKGWRPVKRVTDDIPVFLRLWDGREFVVAVIEKGFESDGVSGPYLLRKWLPPWGPQYPEALLHDWMLELARRGLVSAPKFLVDLTFLMALVSNKTSFLRGVLMFLAVRTKSFEPA